MPFGEDLPELVQRELAQARESGHAVETIERRFLDAAPDDAVALESLYQEILIRRRK